MRVLFLCNGNSARSQMAEGFGKTLAQGRIDFHSAGMWPSKSVDPTAILVMSERGIDISRQVPKPFTSVPKPIDWIIALCDETESPLPAHVDAQFERWRIRDPALAEESVVERLDVFREVRDEIEIAVKDFIKRNDSPLSS